LFYVASKILISTFYALNFNPDSLPINVSGWLACVLSYMLFIRSISATNHLYYAILCSYFPSILVMFIL